MKKLIISNQHPNGTLIDLTIEEIAQREKDIIEIEKNKLVIQQKKEEYETNKQSAISKLKALGLNDAEIKAITGI
jgi:glycosylphosphatidylinositol transamidase (GPIT) subunit GPI8